METQTRARVPALDMIRAYPAVLLLASGAISLAYVLFYTITTFSLAYGTERARPQELDAPLRHPDLGDHHGRRRAGLRRPLGQARQAQDCAWRARCWPLLWAFPMFWLFDTGNPVLITVAFSVGMVAFAVLYGPMGAYLPELFGTRLRYSGASVSYNLGGVLGGAFAPILASSLLIVAGGSWAISLYIALMALLSLACLYFLAETHLSDISGMREEERDFLAGEGVVPK